MPHTAAGEDTPWPTGKPQMDHPLPVLFTYNLEDKETVYCWPPGKTSLLHLCASWFKGLCIYPPEAPFSTLWPYTLQSREGMGDRENRKSLLHRSGASCQDLTDPEEPDTPLK